MQRQIETFDGLRHLDPSTQRLSPEELLAWANSTPAPDFSLTQFIPPSTPLWAVEPMRFQHSNEVFMVSSHPRTVSPTSADRDCLRYLSSTATPDPDILTMTCEDASTKMGTQKIRAQLQKGLYTRVSNVTMSNLRGCQTELDSEGEIPVLLQTIFDYNTMVEAQDHFGRHSRNSHSRLKFGDFLMLFNDPFCCLNLLDANTYSNISRPTFISLLADDKRALHNFRLSEIKGDGARYGSWVLITHPLSFTHFHHDSSGAATYVTGVKGKKHWYSLRFVSPPTGDELNQHYQRLADQNVFCMEYSKEPQWVTKRNGRWRIDERKFEELRMEWEKYRIARFHVVELEEEMTLIQPPNVTHAVYNPTGCITEGGHFFSYEALTHTRNGARADALYIVTNDTHGSFHQIMRCLALNHLSDPGHFRPINDKKVELMDTEMENDRRKKRKQAVQGVGKVLSDLKTLEERPILLKPLKLHLRNETAALARIVLFPERYTARSPAGMKHEEYELSEIEHFQHRFLKDNAQRVMQEVAKQLGVDISGVYESGSLVWTESSSGKKVPSMLHDDFRNDIR